VNDTTYDGIGRLTESVVANSSNTTQITNDTTYDGAGDVLTQSFNGTPISEGTSSAAFTFDALERPSTTSVNSVSQTSLTYAPGGQVATRSDSLVSATASSFTYDPLGRLVTAYSPLFGSSSNKVGFTWRLDGLLDGRSQYSGLASLAYTYDGAKRPLTECSSSTCSGATVDVERSYDRTSNVASETQTLTGANTNQNGTQSFTYDALDRVTGSTLGAITKSYTYDASGNRLTATDGGVTSTFTYDRADEIIKNNYASTDHSFTYDAYGNLTGESVSNGGSAASTSYVYDLADRMTKITQADGSIVGFTFDSLGRHATRTTGLTPTTIDTFGYVGSSDVVVQDFENQASVTINAAIDASADRLMTSTGVSSNAWLIPDLHGNVIGQTGTTGTVTDAFRYDCYGLAEGTTLTGSIPTPWRYQGRLLEATSAGRDLYDFTARSYAPDLGAFTQLDSVAGSAQNPASLNRYLYAAANPETLVDPSGHAARHPNNGSSCGPTCQAGSTATCDVHCQQDKRDSGIPPPSAPPTKPPDPTSSLSCSASWRTYTCRTPDQIAIDNKINAGIGDTLSDILGAAWRQATCLATGAYAPMNCSSTVMDVAQTTIDPVGTGTAIGNQWAADLNSGDPRRQTHAASSILLSLFGLATAAVGLPEADSSIVDDTIPAYARSAYGPVPSELRSGVLVDHPICVYCGRSQSISLDHISANKQDWISGGWRDSFAVRTARANNPENLTGACILCNSTKGARVLGPGDGQWWPPAWLDEEWFPFGGPPN
jgi:RHS repeat-associated protein